MYTLTPDENFIIDLHPNYSNVAIASGFLGQSSLNFIENKFNPYFAISFFIYFKP
jgi:hypothetical protein